MGKVVQSIDGLWCTVRMEHLVGTYRFKGSQMYFRNNVLFIVILVNEKYVNASALKPPNNKHTKLLWQRAFILWLFLVGLHITNILLWNDVARAERMNLITKTDADLGLHYASFVMISKRRSSRWLLQLMNSVQQKIAFLIEYEDYPWLNSV